MKEVKLDTIEINKIANMITALKQHNQYDPTDTVVEAYVKWRNLAKK